MASYKGNIGFQEVMQITLHGTEEQQKRLDQVVAAEDYQGFKELVKEVLNVELV